MVYPVGVQLGSVDMVYPVGAKRGSVELVYPVGAQRGSVEMVYPVDSSFDGFWALAEYFATILRVHTYS